MARVPLAEPDGIVGIDEQEARLLAELAVPDPQRLGLWLHGMGGLQSGFRRGRGCSNVSVHLSWRVLVR